jgi:hypothetical protein
MTERSARMVANVVMASAGAAAAYMVVTRPPVRRALVVALRWWLGASIPLFLAGEAHRAWVESDRTSLR